MWNIRKIIKKGDYLYAVVPEHPKASRFGYVLAHRVVLENKLGRLLLDNEDVHHINGNKKDNEPENLIAVSRGQHQRMHKVKYPGGHFVTAICDNCGKEFERIFCNRKSVKGYAHTFCSKRCSGISNGYKPKPSP